MDRKSLRKKVIEVLKGAKINKIGDDIFSARSVGSQHENLPLILVYTKGESVDRFDESPKSYERDFGISLEIITTHDTDEQLADEMDDLSQLVEDVMERSIQSDDLFKMVNDYDLTNVAYDTEGDGESPIGKVQLDYNFNYTTDESRVFDGPGLKRIKSTYKVNGQQSDDAQDTITLDQ